MFIGREYSAENNDVADSTSTQDSLTSSTDIDFFASIMAESAFTSTQASYTTPLNMIFDASGKLASMAQQMAKSLRALSGEDKFDEARKYPGQLSDTFLLTHFLVKSVGKTAQCVDKICNLQ